MNSVILTGEKAEEYKRLYAEFAVATRVASEVLTSKGMDSKEFEQADAAANKLWSRLRELQGMSGKHWMA